jgi:hypothetical protein
LVGIGSTQGARLFKILPIPLEFFLEGTKRSKKSSGQKQALAYEDQGQAQLEKQIQKTKGEW